MSVNLYPDMPMAEYLALDAISSSQVRAAANGPLHYLASKYGESEETAAMRFGTMAHTMILEPEKFAQEYVVFAHTTSKVKKAENGGCKELWDDAKAASAESGKAIVEADDYQRLCLMADAVKAHPAANKVLSGECLIETTITWEDDEFGLMKARPDIIHPNGLMIDLKTTKDASARGFGQSAARFQYPTQASHHRNGVHAALKAGLLPGLEIGMFPLASLIIAVESEANVWNPVPKRMDHAVAVYEIDEETLVGANLMARTNLADAIALQDTPLAYGDAILPLSLPSWWTAS